MLAKSVLASLPHSRKSFLLVLQVHFIIESLANGVALFTNLWSAIFQICDNRIQYLRDLQDFFGSTFKITQETDNDKVVLGAAPDTLLMTCVGIGYVNTNKKAT